MTNVYNKTVFDRNSIQRIPDGYIESASNNLLLFLGSFWKSIHEGREFIKGIQNVRGIKVAQFYLDLLESLKLQDRRGMPVFHRELWKPLIIRLSKRDKANANLLKIGGGIDLGPQAAGSKYGEGTELTVGAEAGLKGYVTYPVEGDITSIASRITNNIINPTVIYKVAPEFPSEDIVYVNGTLIFPEDKDPFARGSGFEVYDVVDDVRDSATSDQETVLWASDVLLDRNFVAEHMAYALGINCHSTDVIKRILNAGWDAINCGLTPELLRTLLAALLNIPVIQEAEEQVIRITRGTNDSQLVETDKHLYTVYKDAKLRDCVEPGTILHRGDLIDQAIKIYPLLTDVSAEKLAGTTEYADILKIDVPVVSMPRTILRTRTANGLAVDWTPTDILWQGDYYETVSGVKCRKLYFKINGPEDDVDAFWKDVWESAAQEDIDLDDIFANCEYTESSPESGSSSPENPWLIIPAAFFLQHMLGANTLIVTMDRSQVEDSSLVRDQMFFGLVNRVLPSSMRLFFIEHVSVGDKYDEYTMEEPDYTKGEYAMGAVDEATPYILDDINEDEFMYDLPGIKGKKMPTYEEQVEMKFLRNRKRNAE